MIFRTGVALHAAVVMAYVTLTLWQTWPLATAPGAWAPHDLGDPLLSTWALWWNATHMPFTHAWWDGAVFYPAPGTLALSDHRVGIGLITTPLILGGVSPLAAHNVAFLSSYVLSAVSAYVLAFSLTRSRAGAFIAGLVYGFHPFRSEHLPHLELLSWYWLPVVLLALHRWVETFRRRWLALLVASLVLVAFTTGYYFFFLGVLIGLWLLWFVPWNLPARRYAELGTALALPFVPLLPVLLAYRSIHQHYGLGRFDHGDRGSQRRHQGLGHGTRAACLLGFAGRVAHAGGRGLPRCDGDDADRHCPRCRVAWALRPGATFAGTGDRSRPQPRGVRGRVGSNGLGGR